MGNMERSGDCSTWEEETNWKRFHSVQFSQFLPTDFHHGIMLPMRFTDNMMPKLPAKVVLKGPNGLTWNVSLNNIEDTERVRLTGDGWKDFVRTYSLQTKDLLIFKYDRIECFEVLIFDQTSLCQKEASYFVRKCQPQREDGHENSECAPTPSRNLRRNIMRKRPIKDSSSDSDCLTQDTDGSDVDYSTRLRPSNEQKFILRRQKSVKTNGITRKKVPCQSADHNRGREVPSSGSKKSKIYTSGEQDESKTSDEHKSISEKHISEKQNGSRKKDPTRSAAHHVARKLTSKYLRRGKRFHGIRYKSNRRPVTDSEKAKAFEISQQNMTHGSFFVVLSPSAVYFRFHLIIPSEWKASSFFHGDQEVILRIKDRTWVTKFVNSLNHRNGGIGQGWRNFALDNFLEESDVCVFAPADEKDDSFVFDVSIFRVVQETTPLSLAI